MAPIKAKKSEKFQTIGLIGRTRMQEHATFLRKLKKYLEKNKCNILWDEHLSCVYGEKNVETQKKILKKADIAMYCVKDAGKDDHQYYTPQMNPHTSDTE